MQNNGFEREIIELSRRWAEIHKPVQDLTERLAEILKPAIEAAQLFKQQITEATIPLQPIITALLEEDKKYKRVETLGWMPHTTAPWGNGRC